MSRHEDDDIKIFTSDKDLASSVDVDAEVLNTVETMDRERQNGNVNKARVMGKHLAKLFNDEVDPRKERDEQFQDKAVIQQIGVLFLFSAETALNIFLPSSTLSTIATTSLHDQLDDRKSKLYRDVYESSAYSFYYLSIRKGSDNIATSIGEAFAMLCHHEGDPVFRHEGCQLYNKVLNEVESEVKKANFAE